MGRSPAPAPVTYVPEPQAPTIYQSLVSEEDFERAANHINELKAEREKTKAERYLEVGTPEEIGQRMQRRNDITEAAYQSSLPQPEIDYTAGLDPAKLNNLDTFLKDFVDRRTGKSILGTIKKGETASGSKPAIAKTDTAAPVRTVIDAPKPKPAPAPAPAPAPTPAPKPALYNKGKWGTTWGMGSYTTEDLRKRFGLAYSPDLEKEASKRRVGGGTYNEAGDIWGKSSTGKDIYLGRATGLYGNKELIAGHAKQADSGETIHARDNTNLSSIGDRAGAIYNVWKRD